MEPYDIFESGVSSTLAAGMTLRGPLLPYADKASTLPALIRVSVPKTSARLLAAEASAGPKEK